MAPSAQPTTKSFKGGYSRPGASGYRVNKNVTWNDPGNRKLRVITVGAGVSGILMAYRIQQDCPNVVHIIYEKNKDIGGTWLENRYPGCACDVPSHAYSYRFALNPDWPNFFSEAPDIWKYLDTVCNAFNLRRNMNFGTEIVGAYWDTARGEWLVKVRVNESGVTREYDDYCDLLLLGTGVLNDPKWPEIPGLDKFKGKVIHTARWPQEYDADQWQDENVAVIGSGSSSIQVVSALQPRAKHMDIFIRTGVWFGNIANNHGHNKEYSDEEKTTFRKDPLTLVTHAKGLEEQMNGVWGTFYTGSASQDITRQVYEDRMAAFIKDERLLKGYTPRFGVGCRRISPGDVYMMAVQKPNVDVHFTAVTRCTADGILGEDNVERKVDTVICATGFDATYRPRFPIVGARGVDLRDKWSVIPECYLGLAIPDMPNLLTFIGPTWPIENGSVMGPLHSVSDYAVKIIHKMQNEDIKSWVPKQDVTDAFNEHVQEWIKHTIWKDDCRSWYKNNETGRVNAIWPGSSMHYQQVIDQPRYEDFNITYFGKNMWSCLGMGWTIEDRAGSKSAADHAPYISATNLDPQWYRAVGGDVDLLCAEVNKTLVTEHNV